MTKLATPPHASNSNMSQVIDDKDYDFSVDLELITLVESDPSHGYETETGVAHLTKLNDIATLFTHDEKTQYYFILKLFPFSLKGDVKLGTIL